MKVLHSYVASLMAKGVISTGWYSILTGLAMLFVAYLLFGVDADRAAPVVADVLVVVGIWVTARGIWSEVRHRRASEG